MDSCYQILGVDKTADRATIKTAYNKLAKQYHPDKNPGWHLAKDAFDTVTKAYDEAIRKLDNPDSDTNEDKQESTAVTLYVKLTLEECFKVTQHRYGQRVFNIHPGSHNGAVWTSRISDSEIYHLLVDLKPHEGFATNRLDLICKMKIPRSYIKNKTKVKVKNHPRPSGVDIIFPHDTKHGSRVTLTGAGLPGYNEPAGNLIVDVTFEKQKVRTLIQVVIALLVLCGIALLQS